MKTLVLRAVGSTLVGAATMTALIFVPAGTLDYWQAWVFLAIFMGASSGIGIYLAVRDPALLERRMKVGPTAERETAQKVITFYAMLGFVALLVFPALDHRFGWSRVPPPVSIAGDVLVALGFLLTFRVLRENSYAA